MSFTRHTTIGFLRRLSALMMVWVMVGGCDTVPGEQSDERPPRLYDFTLSPTRILFEDLPDEQILADTLARIPLSLSVRVEETGSVVDTVTFLVRAPFSGEEPYAVGVLDRAVGDRFDANVALDIPRGGVGDYDIVVFATDEDGRLSNQARGSLTFDVEVGNPPVVERIVAPETFTPPGTLSLIAVVSDPDGLSNIRSVFVTTPTGIELPMFDDGATQGDERARDGRYTASFTVPNASPGPQTFRFRAVDRSGLVSETVEVTITIL